MVGFLPMSKDDTGSPDESRMCVVQDVRPKAASYRVGSLGLDELASLRAFFSILDEWEKAGTRNAD
jgi:hypothetical protein